MKSHLQLTYTHDMSRPEWLAYRHCGIGASEVAAVMGLDPYKASIQVFNDKVFQRIDEGETIPAFMGKYLESTVADLWQYWDGTPESVVQNHATGHRVRFCRRVNAFIHNPRYPHLFVSLDRQMVRHERGNGPLECKTISGFVMNTWENGIPPQYVVQLQTQLLVTETQYGELAMLKDGRYLEVFPFEAHPGIQEAIVEKTAALWDTILMARAVRHDEHAVVQLAPLPDGSKGWEAYLKDQYKGGAVERDGTQEEFEWGVQQKRLNEQIKAMEADKTLFENKIRHAMGDCDALVFPGAGKISWKADKNGKRTLRVNLKID